MPCKKLTKFLKTWKVAEKQQNQQNFPGDGQPPPRADLSGPNFPLESGPRHYRGSQQLVTSNSHAIGLAASSFQTHHASHVHAFRKVQIRDGEFVAVYFKNPFGGGGKRGSSQAAANSPITPPQTSANDGDHILDHVVQYHVKQSESQPQLGSTLPQLTPRGERGRSLSPKLTWPAPSRIQAQQQQQLAQIQTGSSPPNQIQKSSSSPPELPSTSTHHGANLAALPQPQFGGPMESGAVATSAMVGVSEDPAKPLDLQMPPTLLEHIHSVIQGQQGLGGVKPYGGEEAQYPPVYQVINRYMDTCLVGGGDGSEQQPPLDRGARLVAILGAALLSDVCSGTQQEGGEERVVDPDVDNLRSEVATAVARVCATRLGEEPPPQPGRVAPQPQPLHQPSDTAVEATRYPPVGSTATNEGVVGGQHLHQVTGYPFPAPGCMKPRRASASNILNHPDRIQTASGSAGTQRGDAHYGQPSLSQQYSQQMYRVSGDRSKHVLASPQQVSFARWTHTAESSGRSQQGPATTPPGANRQSPHDDLVTVLDTGGQQRAGDSNGGAAAGQLPSQGMPGSGQLLATYQPLQHQQPPNRHHGRPQAAYQQPAMPAGGRVAVSSGLTPRGVSEPLPPSNGLPAPQAQLKPAPQQPPHTQPHPTTRVATQLKPGETASAARQWSQPLSEAVSVASARGTPLPKPQPTPLQSQPDAAQGARKRQSGAHLPGSQNAPLKRPKLEPQLLLHSSEELPAETAPHTDFGGDVRLYDKAKPDEKKVLDMQKGDGGVSGTPTLAPDGTEGGVAVPVRHKRTPVPKRSPSNPQNAALLQLDLSQIGTLEQFWTAVRQHYSESANISKQYRILFQDWEGDWLMHKKTQAWKALKGRAQKVYIMAT